VSKRSERAREIRALDMASAQNELDEKRSDLFKLRLRKERGDVKNNREFPQLKKDIARLLRHMTDLRNAELMEVSGALDEADEAEADEAEADEAEADEAEADEAEADEAEAAAEPAPVAATEGEE
jgi:ribosomal protein L29